MIKKRTGRLMPMLPLEYVPCPNCHRMLLYTMHEYENGEPYHVVKCKCGFVMNADLFFTIVYEAVRGYKEYIVDYFVKKKL